MTTLSGNKSIFVPVNNISLFTDIDSIGFAQHSKLVLLVDTSVAPTEMYAQRIRELKALDFKFAICKLRVRDFEEYRIILSLMDYIYLDYTKVDITKARIYFNKVYPKVVARLEQEMEAYRVQISQLNNHPRKRNNLPSLDAKTAVYQFGLQQTLYRAPDPIPYMIPVE